MGLVGGKDTEAIMTFTVFSDYKRPHTVATPLPKNTGLIAHRARVNPPGPPLGHTASWKIPDGLAEALGRMVQSQERAGKEEQPAPPPGFLRASGKWSLLPGLEPLAPGRGTTFPFSLGQSLCNTPAQCGGQCRYKGLFCCGADARERGRVAGAAVLQPDRR